VDWRTPKPGGIISSLANREASWTAVALPPARHAKAPLRRGGGYRWHLHPSHRIFQDLWRDSAAENALDR
jgi:hypothetical protein